MFMVVELALTFLVVTLTTVVLLLLQQPRSATVATAQQPSRRRRQATASWARVLRTIVRLLARRRVWHHLGEHLKSYSGLRAPGRYGLRQTGAADGRRH